MKLKGFKRAKAYGRNYNYPQVITTIAVCAVAVCIGFAFAYTGTALVSLMDPNYTFFNVNKHHESWIVGALPLGAFFGSILGGVMLEKVGRKWSILYTMVPFIVSFMLIGFASNVWMIIWGRFLSGVCIGVDWMAIPVFLAETLTAPVRGLMGLMPFAFLNAGILFSYLMGKYFKWRALAHIGTALPIIAMFLMLLVKESPRYYVSIAAIPRARRCLEWLRGKKVNIEPELIEMIENKNASQKSANFLREIFTMPNFRPMIIVLGLMTIQQFTGFYAVIAYIVPIFQSAKMSMDPNNGAIIVGMGALFAVFVAAIVIDILGRKILLYVSLGAMIVALLSLGYYYLAMDLGYRIYDDTWIPLASVVIYILGYGIGFGPIPWLMMGELLPMSIRASGAALASAYNWLCAFIVQTSFPYMIDAMTKCGTFWFYATVCICGLFMVIVVVPETKGKTLELIEFEMTTEAPEPDEGEEEEEPTV